MLTPKEIEDFFHKLSSIDTRDEGALALRDRLISIGVAKQTASDVTTALHQLQLNSDHIEDVERLIFSDKILEQTYIKWAKV